MRRTTSPETLAGGWYHGSYDRATTLRAEWLTDHVQKIVASEISFTDRNTTVCHASIIGLEAPNRLGDEALEYR